MSNDFSTKMEAIFDMDVVRSALMDGDIKNGVMLCGQTAGMIKEIKKVKDVINDIITDGKKIISDFDM